MAALDVHRLLLAPLHRTGVDYMVTGAMAAIAYGEPRMTNDVDLVVRSGHLDVVHHETALRADMYLAGDDPLHGWALERRHTETVADGEIWFAPPEYVIVRKL